MTKRTAAQANLLRSKAMMGNQNARKTPKPADPKPQPGDGPDYHAELAAWERRQR